MKRRLILFLLLLVGILDLSAQQDSMYISDSMPASFVSMNKKQLIAVYGDDHISVRLIKAHYYFNRKRLLLVPGIVGMGSAIYLATMLPVVEKQGEGFGVLILGPTILVAAACGVGFTYKSIEAQVFAGKKDYLYNRLKNYHHLNKLSTNDERMIRKYNNRYIPFLFEITGLIRR
jgi:hypothetical protein